MPTHVTSTPPAPPSEAAEHFARKLALETDCSDVYESMQGGAPNFVLLDVRGAKAYAKAHVAAAISLPHGDYGGAHDALAARHLVRGLLRRPPLQRRRQGRAQACGARPNSSKSCWAA